MQESSNETRCVPKGRDFTRRVKDIRGPAKLEFCSASTGFWEFNDTDPVEIGEAFSEIWNDTGKACAISSNKNFFGRDEWTIVAIFILFDTFLDVDDDLEIVSSKSNHRTRNTYICKPTEPPQIYLITDTEEGGAISLHETRLPPWWKDAPEKKKMKIRAFCKEFFANPGVRPHRNDPVRYVDGEMFEIGRVQYEAMRKGFIPW
jgi:hypothetical protein